MRIAFVGKGGSGKTTLASLFTYCALDSASGNVWVIDADLNMHMAGQLDIDASGLKHLSDHASEKDIKGYLRGENSRIKELAHFKKTTPPAKGSSLIVVKNPNDHILQSYAARRDRLFLSIVGSYDSDGIGASCYHNNLAVLESMLSHAIDESAVVIVDMVAGVDAFAGTLHAQFDMIILVTEPTKKSIEVYEQYKKLSEEADVWSEVFVVGNKITSHNDAEFIAGHIEEGKLIGNLHGSDHIRAVERGEATLDFRRLEEDNQEVFGAIYQKLSELGTSSNKRLAKLHKLHEKYVAQGHVKDRFGDLSDQIDTDFSFDEPLKRHG